MLSSYGKRFPKELDRVEQFIDFVDRNVDCFERSLAEGHITGSAFVCNQQGDATLLTHHRKLDIWVQPGGHADGCQDILKVASDEATEETGFQSLKLVGDDPFDIDIHFIPARKGESAHFHYDVRFLFQCEEDEAFTVSEESHDLAWVKLAELENVSQEWSLRRMRDKALRALGSK